MMGGLVIATLLTLIFLPALYAAWFRVAAPRSDATPHPSFGHPLPTERGEGRAPRAKDIVPVT